MSGSADALRLMLDFRRKAMSHLPRVWTPVAERRPRLNLGFRLAHPGGRVGGGDLREQRPNGARLRLGLC